MAAQTMNYIACDVPEGMRLGSWRAMVAPPKHPRLRAVKRLLHRSR